MWRIGVYGILFIIFLAIFFYGSHFIHVIHPNITVTNIADTERNLDMYPFFTMDLPIDKHPHADPYFLEWHMTRYYGGCFDEISKHDYQYQKIVPWIHNFDILITRCGINWYKPTEQGDMSTCVFKFSDNDLHHHHHRKKNESEIHVDHVHVHSDPRHHVYFVRNVLNFYERRFDETGQGIILHSGGGDSSVGIEHVNQILNSRAVFRWVIEQNRHDVLINHPKVIQLPIGMCGRENVGVVGKELRTVISELPVVRKKRKSRRYLFTNISISADTNNNDSHDNNSSDNYSNDNNGNDNNRNDDDNSKQIFSENNKLKTNNEHPSLRKLNEIMQNATKWSERKNKIFFCFHHEDSATNQPRYLYTKYALENCTICDVCNTSLPHIDLWRTYGQYKFVFSPWGNGADCFRSWEILLMGAIPVIKYFPGAEGYRQGNLSTVLVREPLEMNEKNMSAWLNLYHSGNEKHKLSSAYWNTRVFKGLHHLHNVSDHNTNASQQNHSTVIHNC